MEKEKLIRQLFIGKVSDIIGINKTYELLKDAKKDVESIKETNNKPEIEMWKMLNQINIIMFENYMISKEQILKKEPAEKIMQILEQWAKNY